MTQPKPAPRRNYASREGKKIVSAWIDLPVALDLKVAAAKHKTTIETIVAEGIVAMLKGKFKA